MGPILPQAGSGYLFSIMFGALALVILPGMARAQHRLHGTITDENGHPLQNAQVYIYELKRGTVTDQGGNYEFNDLPGRKLTFSFSFVGYEKKAESISLENKQNYDLSVQLSRKTVTGEPVLISGSQIEDVDRTPLNSSVISGEEITDEGESSLWSALQHTQGVELQTNGPGIERPVIRGMSTDRIKIYNRGAEYNYQTWDPESGLSMSGNGIEQVEIIRGPASLQYGGGAMGGVISLAEERPAPVGKTVGQYRLGLFSNTLGVNNQLSLKKAQESSFYGFSGSFDSHGDYKTGGKEAEGESKGEEARAPNSRYNHLQLQANGGLSRPWGNTRITYEFLQHKNGIIEDEGSMPGGEKEKEGRSIHRPYHNLLDHSLVSETNWYRGNTHLNLTFGLQSNEQQEYEEKSGSVSEEGAAMDLVLNSVNYNLGISREVASNIELNGGLQGNLQRNESKGEEAFVPDANMADAGIYGILDWQATPRFSIQGGARYDYNSIKTKEEAEEGGTEPANRQFNVPEEVDRSFNNASGSIGFVYRAASQFNIKANVGAGYRTPNLAELTADGLLREIRRYMVGANDLSPERNIETDISFGYNGENISADINGFYNAFSNYIYPEKDGLILVPQIQQPGHTPTIIYYPVFRYRQSRATLYGGEAGVSLHPETLPWFEISSRFNLVIGTNEDRDESLPLIPAPNWANRLTLSKPALGSFRNLRLAFSLRSYFDQNRTPDYEEDTPGYLLTDVNLGASLPLSNTHIRFDLAVHNLFNVEYVGHLSLLKYDDILNMGRNISLTAHIPFSL